MIMARRQVGRVMRLCNCVLVSKGHELVQLCAGLKTMVPAVSWKPSLKGTNFAGGFATVRMQALLSTSLW